MVSQVEGCTFSANFSLEHLNNFWVLKFIQVKTNTGALGAAPDFQLHLKVSKFIITRKGIMFALIVDAGFEALLNQDCNGRTHCNTLVFFITGALHCNMYIKLILKSR